MKWFRCTWYNIRKQPENSFEKKYNKVYQQNKEKYFKKIFHWNWSVPHINFEGIEFVHCWERTHLVFSGAKNLYWIIFRDSSNYGERGKFKLKAFKTSNDHCSCG